MPITCYLINLDRSADRLASFLVETEMLAISVVRVPAVDGTLLVNDERDRLFGYRSGRLPVGPGEMACFLSHREVWKTARDGFDPWVFVAEDDVHFERNAGVFFRSFDWFPDDADIVKAETVRRRIWLSPDLHSKPNGHELRVLNSYHGGSAGYFVSKGAATKLLELTEERCDPLDHILFDEAIGVSQNLRIYQLDPALCIQDYLVTQKGMRHGFKSTLNADRKWSKSRSLYPLNPKGIAKLWREIRRPFVRAVRRVDECRINASGKFIIKKISINGY